MQKLLSILIVLLFALPGWAATYYVSTSGTAKGATACATFLAMAANQSTPAKTVADMNSCAASLSDGDVIAFQRGETWAEVLQVDRVNISFVPYGDGEPPTFTGGSYSMNCVYTGQTFTGLRFRSKGIRVGGINPGPSIRYCIIDNIPYSDSWPLLWYGTFAAGAGFYNCTFWDIPYAGLLANGAGNGYEVKNCIIAGSSRSGYNTLRSPSGSRIDYGNNIFFGSAGYTPGTLTAVCGGGGTCNDLGGNLLATNPMIQTQRYPVPRVSVHVDHSVAYMSDLIAAAPYVKISFSPIYGYKINASYDAAKKATLAAHVATGNHEILAHGGSHSWLAQPNALQITNPSSYADPQLIIDGTTKTLTLTTSTGGGAYDISVSWSSTPVYLNTLTAPTTGMLAVKGWGSANVVVDGWLRLSSLADITCSTFPCQVLTDKGTATNRYYYDEIVTATQETETAFGLAAGTLTGFSYPTGTGGGGGDAATSAYLQAALSGQFKGARDGTYGTSPTVGAYLDSINVYLQLSTSSPHIKGDGAEATIRANARNVYGWAVANGGVLNFYIHGPDDVAAEMTVAQTTYFLDELNKLGVQWVKFTELCDWIKSDHATADGYTYTKTYPNTSDYRLRVGSPAINAGVDVGLTTDIEGKPIVGLPDIGAYEYQETGIPAGLFIGRRHKHMIQ